MDTRTSKFLKSLCEKGNAFINCVPEIATESDLDLSQWKKLSDMVYKNYHHMGQKKKGQNKGKEQHGAHLSRLKKEAGDKKIFYSRFGSDHQFQKISKAGLETTTEFRVYINTCSVNLHQIGFYLLDMLANKKKWQGVLQFKFAVEEYFDKVSDAIVVYCANENIADDAARQLSDKFGSLLVAPSVEFAREIKAGLAIGESPIDFNCSFGELRSMAVAKAVRWYFHPDSGRNFRFDYFKFLTERSFVEFGIDANRVYRNGSEQPKIKSSRGEILPEILTLLNHFYIGAHDAGLDIPPSGLTPGPSGVRGTGSAKKAATTARNASATKTANKAATGRNRSRTRGHGRSGGRKGSPSKKR